MSDYLCPHCQCPTEDYAEHVHTDDDGEPMLPVRWLGEWGVEQRSPHAHARRFEREPERRRFGGGLEYRYGIVANRVCWSCESVMPHSVCETR